MAIPRKQFWKRSLGFSRNENNSSNKHDSSQKEILFQSESDPHHRSIDQSIHDSLGKALLIPTCQPSLLSYVEMGGKKR